MGTFTFVFRLLRFTFFRLPKYFEERPPYECEKVCNAPDDFFYGHPTKISPQNSEILLPYDGTASVQFKTFMAPNISSADLETSTTIDPNNNELSAEYTEIEEDKVKLIVMKLTYKGPVTNSDKKWTLKVSNSKGSFNVTVVLGKDCKTNICPCYRGPWTEWSQCSKSCGRFGRRNRTQIFYGNCQKELSSKETIIDAGKILNEEDCFIKLCMDGAMSIQTLNVQTCNVYYGGTWDLMEIEVAWTDGTGAPKKCVTKPLQTRYHD